MQARMLIIGFTLITASPAFGASPEELATEEAAPETGRIPESAKRAAADSKPAEASGPVVAMNARENRAVHAGELLTAGALPMVLVGKRNQRVELSPRAVAEFDDKGSLRLLRGSALSESREESVVRTAGARVEYVGKVMVSYDHAEQSSSAFVIDGEARIVNAHRDDSSVRLQRFRGATLVVGAVLPQLTRQLDVGAVESWLKGYSWPEERVHALLKGMPGGEIVAGKTETPKHLEDTKIEDYFSSIDTADEAHQPDFYDRKFDDPDKVVAEQNSNAAGRKALSPEEAALISLPKTQIDLGFNLGPEFLTAEQKTAEVARVVPPSVKSRAPASEAPKARKLAKKRESPTEEGGDPDVSFVLSRLRNVRNENPVKSQGPSQITRSPSSVAAPVVLDPAYDYSQNF